MFLNCFVAAIGYKGKCLTARISYKFLDYKKHLLRLYQCLDSNNAASADDYRVNDFLFITLIAHMFIMSENACVGWLCSEPCSIRLLSPAPCHVSLFLWLTKPD